MAFVITTVAVIGFTSGNTTLKNSWKIFAPSITAASSRESGTLLKNPYGTKNSHAQPEAAIHRISPKVFLSPSASIRFTSGYITDWNGISIAAVKQRNRKLLALVLFLTIIQAERDEITNDQCYCYHRDDKCVSLQILQV